MDSQITRFCQRDALGNFQTLDGIVALSLKGSEVWSSTARTGERR
jgi:hypothetical protein